MEHSEIIKEIITAIFDAFQSGNTDEIEKHLHDEASVWDVFTPEMIIGRKNLEDFHDRDQEQKESRGNLSSVLEKPLVREWNDIAVATYCLEFEYQEPNALKGKVRITDVFVLENEHWKIFHHHEGIVPKS